MVFALPSRLWLPVIAALLITLWWLRRRARPDAQQIMAQRLEQDAADLFKRWVQNAFLVVTGNCDYAYLPRAEAVRMLSGWWEVHGPAEHRRVLAGLAAAARPDNAWDLLRFILLGRLGVHIPHRANLWVYLCGLAMVISPAKAGEVVKPYLVRVLTGAPLERTIPALVAERVTDGLAVVMLATVGVAPFAPDRADVVFFAVGVLALGFAVLLSKRLSLAILALLRRIPMIGAVGEKLEDAYLAMRECLSPIPLLVTVGMSLVAWWAECVGLWLVFRGMDVHTSLETSTFLYAFSTTAGGFSPGGLGVTDVALIELGQALVKGLTEGQATAASLLIRIATLWFGVVLGSVALLRIEDVIKRYRTV